MSACRKGKNKSVRYSSGVISLPETNEWYSVPEIADFLGVRQRDVRTLISDRRIFAMRRGENNALAISGDQLVEKDGHVEVLGSIRGTLMSLHDAGYSDEEAGAWMHRVDDELGETPLEALRAGRMHAVRRVIAGLAF